MVRLRPPHDCGRERGLWVHKYAYAKVGENTERSKGCVESLPHFLAPAPLGNLQGSRIIQSGEGLAVVHASNFDRFSFQLVAGEVSFPPRVVTISLP